MRHYVIIDWQLRKEFGDFSWSDRISENKHYFKIHLSLNAGSIMNQITVNHLIFDILFDYALSASRVRESISLARGDYAHNNPARIYSRAKEENRVEPRRRRRRKSQPRCRSRRISLDLSLDRGFANNGALARGAFFRWRLDTYRIYILLLLLGKRSSAKRLFNTTRSLSGLFYDREAPARCGMEHPPSSPSPPLE